MQWILFYNKGESGENGGDNTASGADGSNVPTGQIDPDDTVLFNEPVTENPQVVITKEYMYKTFILFTN